MTTVTGSAFAELLRRHRAGAGLGQRELARRSGLSERALRDLERGVRTPRVHSARLVADALALAGDDRSAFLRAARPETTATTVDVAAAPAPVVVARVVDDLVGRQLELRTLEELVVQARHRLVTVTGRAGIGKSRIAVELAGLLSGRTDLGVRVLDLSAVQQPELIGELIAMTVGCGPSRLPPLDRIAAHLRDQRMVLILDRFEHLVGAATQLVDLVRRCPRLTLVVTSQRRLQVRDERVVELRPLAPDAAAMLFRRRAGAVSPGFTADDALVTTICRQVEHLPLAIELAAARVRLLQPAELAERLDRQLQMLAGGARDLPARHRSLRAAIESSLDVVTPASGALFRRLGGFVGGGVLGDLEAVAAAFGHDRDWLLTGLAELVDMCLVRVAAEGATSRYTLPDTMAELAAEQLASSPERDAVERAVATGLLERLRHSYDGSGPAVHDHDAANVRNAVDWALVHQLVDVESVAPLGRFYETTGRLVEGQEVLCRIAARGYATAWVRAGQLAALRGDLGAATELSERGLRDAAAEDHVVRVSALNLLAQTAIERGDPVAGRTRLRSALVEARRARSLTLIGRVLNNLASASAEVGRPEDAERLLLAALQAKRRAAAGPVEIGRTLFNLAEIALELGADEAAAVRAGEAVPVLRSGGFSRLAAAAESTVALAQLRRARLPAALAAVGRSARLLRAGDDGDDRRTEAVVLLRHSVVLHAAGKTDAARDSLRAALAVALDHTTRDRDEAADALHTHAFHLARRDPEGAAAMVGAGDHLRRRPVSAPIRSQRDHAADLARRALGTATFAARVRLGATLDRAGLLRLCGRITAHTDEADHPVRRVGSARAGISRPRASTPRSSS